MNNEKPAVPQPRESQPPQEKYDDIGLSIDMLDVDRLRAWAQNLLTHGPDISHWGSVPFVVGKMQAIATGMERAIKDIGVLRSKPAGSAPAPLPSANEKWRLRAECAEETCADIAAVVGYRQQSEAFNGDALVAAVKQAIESPALPQTQALSHKLLIDRANSWLSNGGLFNPELMPPDAARDIIIDFRDCLIALQAPAESEVR